MTYYILLGHHLGFCFIDILVKDDILYAFIITEMLVTHPIPYFVWTNFYYKIYYKSSIFVGLTYYLMSLIICIFQ